MSMKSRIANIIIAAIIPACCWAQVGLYSNPALEALLFKAHNDLKDYKVEIAKEQTKTQAAMALIDVNLERIHKVENQWLDYLKTSYNTIQNAHQLVDITNLLIDIPTELKELGEAMKKRPMGVLKYGAVVAYGAFHQKEGELTQQVVKSYYHTVQIIQQLILNGKSAINKDSLYNQYFDLGGGVIDTNMSYHKASLLNSYERLNLLDQLRGELTALKNTIRQTKYMINSITWWGVWRGISAETYWAFINGEQLVKQVIATYKL